jgi:hypothetical protein
MSLLPKPMSLQMKQAFVGSGFGSCLSCGRGAAAW